MIDLHAFLKETRDRLSVPPAKAKWVPIEEVTRWVLENGKTVSFLQAEAWDYGLRADYAEREHAGKTLHFLKFERIEQCQEPTPHPSQISTEHSK